MRLVPVLVEAPERPEWATISAGSVGHLDGTANDYYCDVVCTRCGHPPCPCCSFAFCDRRECIWGEDDDSEEETPCYDNGCAYPNDEPPRLWMGPTYREDK